MADKENQVVDDAEQATNEPQTNEAPREYTALEQEAMAQGWVPEEEYNGDPDRFVTAKEFIQRGEFFRKIESQSKIIKDLNRQIEHLARMSKQSFEAGVKKTLQELKQAKKEAFAEGDVDRVTDIDEQILEVKTQAQLAAQQNAQRGAEAIQEVHPELQAWIGRNRWYETDVIMRGAADALGVQLANQGYSPTEVLHKVEQQIKEQFPQKFRNVNRDRPNAVENGSGRRGGRGASVDDVELTPLEREMMGKLVKAGHLTEKEYKAQIKEARLREVS